MPELIREIVDLKTAQLLAHHPNYLRTLPYRQKLSPFPGVDFEMGDFMGPGIYSSANDVPLLDFVPISVQTVRTNENGAVGSIMSAWNNQIGSSTSLNNRPIFGDSQNLAGFRNLFSGDMVNRVPFLHPVPAFLRHSSRAQLPARNVATTGYIVTETMYSRILLNPNGSNAIEGVPAAVINDIMRRRPYPFNYQVAKLLGMANSINDLMLATIGDNWQDTYVLVDHSDLYSAPYTLNIPIQGIRPIPSRNTVFGYIRGMMPRDDFILACILWPRDVAQYYQRADGTPAAMGPPLIAMPLFDFFDAITEMPKISDPKTVAAYTNEEIYNWFSFCGDAHNYLVCINDYVRGMPLPFPETNGQPAFCGLNDVNITSFSDPFMFWPNLPAAMHKCIRPWEPFLVMGGTLCSKFSINEVVNNTVEGTTVTYIPFSDTLILPDKPNARVLPPWLLHQAPGRAFVSFVAPNGDDTDYTPSGPRGHPLYVCADSGGPLSYTLGTKEADVDYRMFVRVPGLKAPKTTPYTNARPLFKI